MTANVCGKCGSPNMSTSKFCARCGNPLAAGRPARQEEGERGPSSLAAGLLWFLDLCPGLVRPQIIILFVLALPLAVGLGWLGVFVLMMGAIFSGGAIAAFGLIVYWTAWAWVFYGYVCFPSEALADFNSRQWLMMILVTVLPVAVAAIALGL